MHTRVLAASLLIWLLTIVFEKQCDIGQVFGSLPSRWESQMNLLDLVFNLI